MSGGHWHYKQYEIEEWAGKFGAWCDLLAEFKHVLDWGLSGDTDLSRARLAVALGVERFLDIHFGDDGQGKESAADVVRRVSFERGNGLEGDCGHSYSDERHHAFCCECGAKMFREGEQT